MGKPTSVTGVVRTRIPSIGVEDSTGAVPEFENGALGTIEGSTTCYPGYARRVEIYRDYLCR